MVAVVMGQQYGIDAVGAHAVFPQADLGALAAIQQQGMALHRHSQGRQRPVRQGLCAARAQ